MSKDKNTYWKNFLGIPRYKIDWYYKYFLHKWFGFTFKKLYDQRQYWNERGREYFQEVFNSHHYNYEVFFQDMLIKELKGLAFKSFFEAGCGFGWNVKRVKQEFPEVMISGVDFSFPQLINSRNYLPDIFMPVAQADACFMPLKDASMDVGFSLGVFMNIHPDKIGKAIDEMIRVCKRYIIHLEWDQENTKPSLREKRIFKTNIISHNYRSLYESRGKKVLKFRTCNDFENDFNRRFPKTTVSSWEEFEGPGKYILILVEV